MAYVVRYAYARHALVGALEHVGARNGDVMAVPEFICRDVLASLHHLGVRPRFYAVGRDLRPRDSQVDASSQFVLMVNYFGFPQDVGEFRSKWPNAQIIEDNAHGFLGRDSRGVELGTRTEAGITSCRKTILLPDGALLHIPAESADGRAMDLVERSVAVGFRIRSLASRVERSTGVPINATLRTAVRATRKIRTGSSLPRPDALSETVLPSDIRMSRSAFDILQKLDIRKEVERRRRLFDECREFASTNHVEAIYWDAPQGCAPYGFPFISDSTNPSIARFARKLHGEVIAWPDLPTAVSVPADHFYRQVRVINFL